MEVAKIKMRIKALRMADIVANRQEIKFLEKELEIFKSRDFWDT